jgi:hypothetical protein
LLKRAAKAVGKEALRTGVGVLGDVARGGEFLPSLETHGREAVSNLADKAKDYLATNQSGSGRGRRRKGTRRKTTRKSKQKSKKASKRAGGKRRKPIKAGKTKRRRRTSVVAGGDIFDNV